MTLYAAAVAGVEPKCLWRRLETPSYVVLGLPDRDVHCVVESVTR